MCANCNGYRVVSRRDPMTDEWFEVRCRECVSVETTRTAPVDRKVRESELETA